MRTFDVRTLLEAYAQNPPDHRTGRLVKLSGLPAGTRGYNPSAPSPDGAVIVRVEYGEYDSHSVSFRVVDETHWQRTDTLTLPNCEDPRLVSIHDHIVISGTRLADGTPTPYDYRTWFWRGTTLDHMDPFAHGPVRMKGIRMVEYRDGCIGVFTRPTNDLIGYVEIDDLDDLTDAIPDAIPLDLRPATGCWAVDEAHVTGELVTILGHININYHYWIAVWTFDRATQLMTTPKIVANRRVFPKTPRGRWWARDVIYPGHLDRSRGLLYAGLSDFTVGVLRIADPIT